MVLASIFWDKKRKYYTFIGLVLLLLVVAGVVIMTGKGAADKAATEYGENLPKYVQSLKMKSDSTIEGSVAQQPSLPKQAFGFLSSSYQAAEAKHAAIEESVTYLASINDSYSADKKGELRGTIYYYQSGFFFGRGSAGFAADRKIAGTKSKVKQAAIYATQFKAESKEAAEYIASVEKKTVRRPLYEKEVTKLLEVLHAYKKTADDCAAKMEAAKESTNVQNESRTCDKTLQDQYDTSEDFYNYIAFFPKEIEKFTPVQTLIDQLKKQANLSYPDKNLDTIRLKTRINNTAAIIKTLLPTTKSEKKYDIKISIIRTLNEQLEDAVKTAHIDGKEKKHYQDTLKQIGASLLLYDEPSYSFGDDEPQTFIDKATAISQRFYKVGIKEHRTLSYFDFYTENKKQFAALETPGIVQKEMQTILDNHDKALRYFKEYDDYNKAYTALVEKQEKTKDVNELLSILVEKRPIYASMSEAKKKADVYINKTDELLRTMQQKLEQIDALTKYTADQYDKLLQR